jgi:hypothetical protein
MHFMTSGKHGFDKIQPEIVDIPGGIQHNCDFH